MMKRFNSRSILREVVGRWSLVVEGALRTFVGTPSHVADTCSFHQSRRLFFPALLATVALFSVTGCGKKRQKGGVEAVHWDRDMCERCKMVLSERKYAAEIVNPDTGKVYKFDDIGCAVLWMDEEHIPWKDRAKIWVTDAKTGQWLDARKALYTDDSITPMAYGIAAFSEKTFPKGHKALHFEQAAEVIRKIEAKNNEMRGVKP